MAEQTLNLPQIIAVILVGFLAIRWLLSSSGSQASGSTRGRRQINPAHVEQIHQMFPQLDRRSIAWDLQQNGGSVQATTERVLGGRTLVQPPPSFQPQLPTSTPNQGSSTTRQPQAKAPLPDLISRYNLSSKVTTAETPAVTDQVESDAAKKTGWSQNKTERSELFKRRREEMILAARRRMEAKER
ncbi:hypothetical protein BDZ85DRAFT_186594, partial [Elsinoe ampelina]